MQLLDKRRIYESRFWLVKRRTMVELLEVTEVIWSALIGL